MPDRRGVGARWPIRGEWATVSPRPARPVAASKGGRVAFAAGGVFLTIGSDEPGTGIGEWNSPASDQFAFTYSNFHFDSDAKLNNTVKVRAAGSFSGSTLQGHATLTATDPTATPCSRPATSSSRASA